MRCHQCGSSDVDVDPSRSDVVCMECGAVLSDVSIVSEVNFSEQPSGLSSVVGQFVSLSGSRGLSSSAKRGVGVGGVSSAGYGRDSREQTLSVGRKLLQQLSDTLRLRPIHVDQAYGHFKLAVQHNFIQGRRTRYVAASCMYVACRKSKTPHLLLDLADALQVNLYMLGATLLKLIRVLHISLPIVDPSLYIHRFAAQLQLQPNQSSAHTQQKEAGRSATSHMVAMTALRLVSRMKRDWLQVGRRPSGICGACLLIACRMHGYRRSQREILDVVRICDATLRRRLIEFVSTPSSQLTFVEFEQSNAADEGVEPSAVLDDGHNPPAFTRAIQRQEEADRVERRKQEVTAQLAAKGILDADIERQWDREVSQLLQLPAFAQFEDRQPVTLDTELSIRQLINEHCRARDKAAVDGSSAVKVNSDSAELTIAVNADKRTDAEAVRQILTNQRAAALRGDKPTADIKPATDDTASIEQQLSTTAADLSYVDDAELDEYILTDEEVAFRTTMWDDTHADYIKAQVEKRQQMEQSSDDTSQHDTNTAVDRGRGGRANGGVGGQLQSSLARKKAKLGQSAFFLNATSAQHDTNNSQPTDAKPDTQHDDTAAAAAAAGDSNTLPSDVSAMLSASDIASSAMTGSTHTRHTHALTHSTRPTLQQQQQRRVSGKINYHRLKGLLDNNEPTDTRHTALQLHNNMPQRGGDTSGADEQQMSVKRRKVAQAAESEVEHDNTEEDAEQRDDEDEDEDEEVDDDGEVDELRAASLIRAEPADDDGYGSLDEAHSS